MTFLHTAQIPIYRWELDAKNGAVSLIQKKRHFLKKSEKVSDFWPLLGARKKLLRDLPFKFFELKKIRPIFLKDSIRYTRFVQRYHK